MCLSDLWGGRLSPRGIRPLQLGGTWGYLCTGAPGQPDTAAAAPSGPEWCCLVLGDVTLDAKAIWGRAGPGGHPVGQCAPLAPGGAAPAQHSLSSIAWRGEKRGVR